MADFARRHVWQTRPRETVAQIAGARQPDRCRRRPRLGVVADGAGVHDRSRSTGSGQSTPSTGDRAPRQRRSAVAAAGADGVWVAGCPNVAADSRARSSSASGAEHECRRPRRPLSARRRTEALRRPWPRARVRLGGRRCLPTTPLADRSAATARIAATIALGVRPGRRRRRRRCGLGHATSMTGRRGSTRRRTVSLATIQVGRGASGVAVGDGSVWVANGIDAPSHADRSANEPGHRDDPRSGERRGQSRSVAAPSGVSDERKAAARAGLLPPGADPAIGVLSDCYGPSGLHEDSLARRGAAADRARRQAARQARRDGIDGVEDRGRAGRARVRLLARQRRRRRSPRHAAWSSRTASRRSIGPPTGERDWSCSEYARVRPDSPS